MSRPGADNNSSPTLEVGVFLRFWDKALTSGTSNALLYDTLKGTNQSDDFEKQVG